MLQSIMDNYRGSWDKNTNRTTNNKGSDHEISGKKEDSIWNWICRYLCYILTKSESTFCSSAETLCKAEFKGNRLINLGEEISEQGSI